MQNHLEGCVGVSIYFCQMDYGRVPHEQIDTINFSLPRDPHWNERVLNGKPALTKIYVGLAKWGRKEFIGKIYPKGTKDAQFAAVYAQHFNSIEFNATHYKLYNSQDIAHFRTKAESRTLKFLPKVYQGVSHFGSFDDKGFLTDTFLEGMRGFGDQLGPIFLQVSDKFAPKRKEELFRYLATLPKDLTFFLEVRHPDWMLKPVFDELLVKLTSLQMGLVITDTAGRRDVCHMHLTIPTAFIRFVGNSLHPTDFTRLDGWIARLKYWKQQGLLEAYFMIHSGHVDSFGPELAKYFIEKANTELNAGLAPIQFLG